MEIIDINLPDYKIDSEPSYDDLGRIVDVAIVEHLKDGKYIIRAIGLDDHNIGVDELISRIEETGTDKYDPDRKSVVHDDFQTYDYDIQAALIEIKDGKIVIPSDNKCETFFGEVIYDFYNNAMYDRGYRVRIDLLLVYDASKLTQAVVKNAKAPTVGDKLEQYLFKFKEPERKRESLLGVIKILR